MTAFAAVDAPSQLFESHLLDTTGFQPNDRLVGSVAAFNRFAVTRKLNDGLLFLRFAPASGLDANRLPDPVPAFYRHLHPPKDADNQ